MNICVIVPHKDVYSETFIRAHIERLAGNVTYLYGEMFPTHTSDDRPLIKPHGLCEKLRRMLLNRIFGVSFDPEILKRRAFEKYLSENKIDIVLAEFGPTGTRVMDSCQKTGVSLIVHFHGFDAYRKKTLQDYGEKYPAMFQIADAVVVVSKHMERQVISLGAPKEKVHYVPCGMNEKLFYGADPTKAGPVFLTTGRFVDKKAPHLMLLAFQKVLARVPEAKLIMVGTGHLFDACVALARSLKIESAVTFTGVRPHQEVAEMMREVRAFVQHSVVPESGDSEGTPVAVMEAGGCGLPVIATRHAGIPDVIEDGVTGFLVDEYDIDTMAERMSTIACDPALAARMGQAAREKVLQSFTLEKSIRNLDGIIGQAAERRKKKQ